MISRSETYYSIEKFKIQGHKVTGGLQITLEFQFLRKLGDVDKINLGQEIPIGDFFRIRKKMFVHLAIQLLQCKYIIGMKIPKGTCINMKERSRA